jgi:hypothetical protein
MALLEFLTEHSSCQVAIFVVLALTLRRKPDVLVNLFPKIVGNSKYLGQEKLPIIAWVINQVLTFSRNLFAHRLLLTT